MKRAKYDKQFITSCFLIARPLLPSNKDIGCKILSISVPVVFKITSQKIKKVLSTNLRSSSDLSFSASM